MISSKKNVFRSCDGNFGLSHDLILMEVSELMILFGSLLGQFVGGFDRANGVSTFGFDAV